MLVRHSHPPPHPSILRSKSTSDVSPTPTDSKAASITFAPLPAIDTRKRRRDQPMGLASRAELLRKSRRNYGEAANPPQYASFEDQELPLPDFGKLVKGLWRSVSRGHGEKKGNAHETQRPIHTTTFTEETNTSGADQDDREGAVWVEEVTWTTSSDHSPPSRRDTISTISMVDSGSFLDELDRVGDLEPKEHNVATEGEMRELGSATPKDLG